MKTEFLISNISTGRLNAMVKNIMNQTGITEPEEVVRMMNNGELIVSLEGKKWTEENGVIYFTVTSDGTTGQQWITRLEKMGSRVDAIVKRVLRSKKFTPTTNGTYKIAVLRGCIFSDNDRNSKNIRAEAATRNFTTPNAEVACLIRDKFSDKELKAMGLNWVITMHEPVLDLGGTLWVLCSRRSLSGELLEAQLGRQSIQWGPNVSFAFEVSRIKAS